MRLGFSWGLGRRLGNEAARPAGHWLSIALLRCFLIGATLFMALFTHSLVSAIGYQIQTNAFETTQGEVVRSQVHESSSTSRRGRSRMKFYPQVQAGFVVDGKQYWCEDHRFPTFSSESEARTFLLAYSPGAAVAVHYKPGNPANATLTRGIVMNDVYGTFIVLAINIGLCYGWATAIRGYRRRRRFRRLQVQGRAVEQRG